MLSHLQRSLAALSLALALHSVALADESPRYLDSKATIEDRLADLVGRLTQDEKLSLLAGTGFATRAIPRLGIPAMNMADAGQGVRGGDKGSHGPATAFPCGTIMASTWDVDLVRRIGAAIGEEARNKGTGVQVLLGPAVNIHRTPLGGRNAEYFSEDPYVAARLAVAYIRGMQGTGVAACVKHYACNNQEVERDTIDVRVGERALREIYLPAFEAAVTEGHVWAVMSSYNQVNGAHASANPYLLKDVLKSGWGFDGLVMSDWGGVHQTNVAELGNDLEMPDGRFANATKLTAALADGSLSQAAVDESTRRILRTVLRVGLLDHQAAPDSSVVNSPAHQALALEAATKGIVLLKNDGGLLPIDSSKTKSIAVIGEPATNLMIGALGSSEVKPFATTQILDGIRTRAGDAIRVTFEAGAMDVPIPTAALTVPGTSEHGFKAQYFNGKTLEGTPLIERTDATLAFDTNASRWPGVPARDFSARWTADLQADVAGTYTLRFSGDDGYRVKVDGKAVVERWHDGGAVPQDGKVELSAGTHELEIEYFQNGGDATAKLTWTPPGDGPRKAMLAAAKAADVAIVCVSTRGMESEGNDRPTMDLPYSQADLIRAVAAVNPHTIIVINNGTPVTLVDWIKQTPAVVEAWCPGQAGGAAIAAILFGVANPSGKLASTLAVAREDYGDAKNYPGANGVEHYDEGIFVGYRHFDHEKIAPLFPFGFGLSYTTFAYANAKVSAGSIAPDAGVDVTVEVTNTGHLAGDEVVQLYVHDAKPQIDKAPRELKGFARVSLKPGETKPATFRLTTRDLAYFDVAGKQWRADAGEYAIEIGASSRDIRQTATLHLDKQWTSAVPLSKTFPAN